MTAEERLRLIGRVYDAVDHLLIYNREREEQGFDLAYVMVCLARGEEVVYFHPEPIVKALLSAFPDPEDELWQHVKLRGRAREAIEDLTED